MAKPATHSSARQQLLRAALKRFANSGYAATSVQDIVDDAKLSKPALYYHFKDKAGLFQALVHEAHDERYRLLRDAAEQNTGIRAQLEAMLATLFAYFREHRDLVRLSFASMFAAPGEMPRDAACVEKCARNFEFVRGFIQAAQQCGELDRRFDSEALTLSFYGLGHLYLIGNLVCSDCQTDPLTARRIVELFLAGAGPKSKTKAFKKTTKGEK